jgi:hypothetical protein
VKAQQVVRVVHTVDIAPTIAKVLGIAAPPTVDGKSLKEIVEQIIRWKSSSGREGVKKTEHADCQIRSLRLASVNQTWDTRVLEISQVIVEHEIFFLRSFRMKAKIFDDEDDKKREAGKRYESEKNVRHRQPQGVGLQKFNHCFTPYEISVTCAFGRLSPPRILQLAYHGKVHWSHTNRFPGRQFRSCTFFLSRLLHNHCTISKQRCCRLPQSIFFLCMCCSPV